MSDINKNYNVAYWRDLWSQNAPDVPWERAAAWIAEESSGYPQALGSRYEVGICQIDMQDGGAFGGTVASLHGNFCSTSSPSARFGAIRIRDLTDDEEILQVTSGAAMMRAYYADAGSRIAGSGVTWTDDEVWALAKLKHALPALLYGVASASRNGQCDTWQAFRAYVERMSSDDVAAACNMSTVTAARYYPFSRFFDNAERVGSSGGVTLGTGISQLGKTLVVLALLGGFLYYGGHHAMAI